MADTPNARARQMEAIQALLYSQNIYLGLANRDIEAALRDARSGSMPTLTPNITVDTPADRDATVTAPGTYSTATLASISFARKLVRATSQVAFLDTIESAGGRNLEAELARAVTAVLNGRLDVLVAGVVSAVSYQTVGTANGNDNKIAVGSNSQYIGHAFPYAETGDAYEAFAKAGLQALALLWNKNLINPIAVGTNAPTPRRAAWVMPSGLALAVVQYLADQGIDLRESIPSRAAVDAGIGGSTEVLSGPWAGLVIIPTNATGVATSSAQWASYVIPIGSSLRAAAFAPYRSPQRFLEGNTAGAAVNRDTYLLRWAGVVPYATRIIQITMRSAASQSDSDVDSADAPVLTSRLGLTTDDHDRLRFVHPEAPSFVSFDLPFEELGIPDEVAQMLADREADAKADQDAANAEAAKPKAAAKAK
ncbi:MAG: hypothetical protein F4153_03200 [Acidimicrobiia bacterium]|nr:hypothetical protein [Acidimicrobiia bacterium]